MKYVAVSELFFQNVGRLVEWFRTYQVGGHRQLEYRVVFFSQCIDKNQQSYLKRKVLVTITSHQGN